MKVEIDEYVNLYGRIWSKVNDWQVQSDGDAVEITNAILQEIRKDARMDEINLREKARRKKEEKPTIKNPDAPASQKQKDFMDQLSIPYAADITKGQASEMIDKKLSEKKS